MHGGVHAGREGGIHDDAGVGVRGLEDAGVGDHADVADQTHQFDFIGRFRQHCGGGRVSYYLASLLEKGNMDVRLLERSRERCVELAETLIETSVIHGDCSNLDVLESQGFDQCDALVALTGLDELNMIVSLYAVSRGIPQVITKLGHGETRTILHTLPLGSIISPKELCSNDIVRYVRAMQNQTGAAVSVHAIADGQVEAVEFLLDDTTANCGVPLKNLNLRSNVLIASTTHGAATHIPNGESVFSQNDTVVVVTSGRGVLQKFNDIFA